VSFPAIHRLPSAESTPAGMRQRITLFGTEFCFLPWRAPLEVVLREYLTMVGRTDSVLPRINLSRLSFIGNQKFFKYVFLEKVLDPLILLRWLTIQTAEMEKILICFFGIF
jgi:hypothetical protein